MIDPRLKARLKVYDLRENSHIFRTTPTLDRNKYLDKFYNQYVENLRHYRDSRYGNAMDEQIRIERKQFALKKGKLSHGMLESLTPRPYKKVGDARP